MALPASGAISFNDVNVELGLSGTAQISLNDAAVRGLFGVASGAISMSDGYGKSSEFAFTIASNTTDANLRSLAVAAGWDESTSLVATLDSGIYISSTGTGTPALTIDGAFPSGVKFVNSGTVVGDGGNGGGAGGPGYSGGSAGGTGGTAVLISVPVSIENNGVIAGGGGGGGGGGGAVYAVGKATGFSRGGGGGGGQSGLTNSSGGAGNQSGAAGTVSAAGGGGSGGPSAGTGGTGGGWGANGGAAFGGTPGDRGPNGAGGSGGAATSGQSYVTWVATGTRYGTIG